WLLVLASAASLTGIPTAMAGAPPAPLAAIALSAPGQTILEWVPGGAAPDSYSILGQAEDGSTSVIDTVSGSATQAVEQAGYVAYAIAANVDGKLSPWTFAINSPANCVRVE